MRFVVERVALGRGFLPAFRFSFFLSFLLSFFLSFHQSINSSIRFFLNSCRRLPETKHYSSLFLNLSGSKFHVVMAACTPSIHIFLGRPLLLLSRVIHSIINFGILSPGILLIYPDHFSLFLSMMSMISGFPFTPIIYFIFSFRFYLASIIPQMLHNHNHVNT